MKEVKYLVTILRTGIGNNYHTVHLNLEESPEETAYTKYNNFIHAIERATRLSMNDFIIINTIKFE